MRFQRCPVKFLLLQGFTKFVMPECFYRASRKPWGMDSRLKNAGMTGQRRHDTEITIWQTFPKSKAVLFMYRLDSLLAAYGYHRLIINAVYKSYQSLKLLPASGWTL